MNKTILYYVFGILVFAGVVYYASQSLVFSLKTSPPVIHFLKATEIQKVINKDDDHYYDTFHQVDFDVRQIKNKKEYLEKIAKSGCEGDDQVREKITQCIHRVHDTLLSKQHAGIHMETFLKIPWKIGFVCDKRYENGLPHTRGDVIILNAMDVKNRTTSQVCRLLIHEKTHVYQKTKDMSGYLKENYKVVGSTKKKDNKKDESIPANPDTDSFIYKNIETNEVLQGKYNKTPTHFRDISFTRDDHTLEHPFEHMAYNMERLYVV